MSTSQLKLCITYICTGNYNVFFKDFYESFKDCFCPNNYLTFAVITDNPSLYTNYKDCKVYYVQRHYKYNDLDFIKFRKWQDVLLCEDLLETQDYCFYINGNLRCNQKVTIDELFQGKNQYAVYHSLFDLKNKPMYESLTECKNSAAYFNAKDQSVYPNYKYFQAGNVGATSKQFLKMCKFIESCRQYDAFYGFDKYIKWHDETYYNKYINTMIKKDPNCINVIDGKKYLCSWLKEMKPYVSSSKMILVNKDETWKKELKHGRT